MKIWGQKNGRRGRRILVRPGCVLVRKRERGGMLRSSRLEMCVGFVGVVEGRKPGNESRTG